MNEEVASFLDEWVRGETVTVENEEETWLLEESLSPSEDPLGLKAMQKFIFRENAVFGVPIK